jgi:hypothetical protein
MWWTGLSASNSEAAPAFGLAVRRVWAIALHPGALSWRLTFFDVLWRLRHQTRLALCLDGGSNRGGQVMRTTVIAAPPRDLHWQSAFTTAAYKAQTPIVWHHQFVSDSSMMNWSDGLSRQLTWTAKKSRPKRRRRSQR